MPLSALRAAAGDEEQEPEVSFDGVPLFEQPQGEDAERIERISVIRLEPIEEGHVGYVEPDAAEEDIRRKFGGGKFRLQAKTSYGKPVKGGFKTVVIAGDPIFDNVTSIARWKRKKKQEAQIDAGEDPEQPGKREPSALELMELADRKEEARRARDREEYERREAAAEANHRRELERLRIEGEARERMRQEDEARRERDRLAADERRDREAELSRARDREHQATLMALQQQSAKQGGLGSTLELLAAAKELFAPAGDGGGDPVTALIQNIPQIVSAGSSIAAQLESKAPAPPAQAGARRGFELTLTGAHAIKLAKAIKNMQEQGIDPDATILRAYEALAALKNPDKGKAQGEPAQGAAEGGEQETQQAPAAEQPPRPPVKRRPAHRPGRR